MVKGSSAGEARKYCRIERVTTSWGDVILVDQKALAKTAGASAPLAPLFLRFPRSFRPITPYNERELSKLNHLKMSGLREVLPPTTKIGL